jgi:hypothetical protein
LVDSTEGDAGGDGDGFDSALASLASAAAAWGNSIDSGASVLSDIDSALADWDAISDTLTSVLADAAAIYDEVSDALTAAADVLTDIGELPVVFQIPGLPLLPELLLPDVWDILGYLTQFLGVFTDDIEAMVYNEVTDLMAEYEA